MVKSVGKSRVQKPTKTSLSGPFWVRKYQFYKACERCKEKESTVSPLPGMAKRKFFNIEGLSDLNEVVVKKGVGAARVVD